MKQKNVSVEKAFQIIFLIGEELEGITLTSLSKKLGIHKTTALRFLNSLEKLGVVERRDGKYFLGIKLYELGNRVPVKRIIVNRVHPLLKELVEDVNETVNLAELSGTQVHYLDKLESQRSLQINTYIGALLPSYCTALGKAILAHLPLSLRFRIVSEIKFEKRAKNTITDPDEFLEHLQEVKKKGYSVDNEEFEEGLRCVAVPLFLPEYGFYGAISVSGPVTRLGEDKIPEVAEKLRETAKKAYEIFRQAPTGVIMK